jgi:hypothetical protein
MDKKKFNTLLNNFKLYQNNEKIDEKLLNTIIDVFNNTMLKHYNNIGLEWINWFMYDIKWGAEPSNVDGPRTVNQLYDLLELYYKNKDI